MTDNGADTLLTPFRQAYSDRLSRARRHRQAGGRVMGFIGDGVPRELISAAGFLPYRLSGNGDATFPLVERHIYPSFQKAAQERRIFLHEIEAMLERLLAGDFDFLDHLVIPYTRKEISQVHGQLRSAKLASPELRLPDMTILDRTMSDGHLASEFNRHSLARFRDHLEEIGGGAVTDAQLRAEIAAGNEQRRLLSEIGALRLSPSPLIRGVDALAIFATSQWLPLNEHLEKLSRLLAAKSSLPSMDGFPVFVAGSSLDTSRYYELLEQNGALVCGENHDWGQRLCENMIDESLPPFEALAERFNKHSAAFRYPLARSAAECGHRARRSGASAAIFRVTDGDMMAIFNTPAEREAIEAQSIRCFVSAEQPYGDANATIPEELMALLASASEDGI